MNVHYAVIQTGKRTWQLAVFDELDGEMPCFAMLDTWKFRTQLAASLAADQKQSEYEAMPTKVVRHLAIDKAQTTPHAWHAPRVQVG